MQDALISVDPGPRAGADAEPAPQDCRCRRGARLRHPRPPLRRQRHDGDSRHQQDIGLSHPPRSRPRHHRVRFKASRRRIGGPVSRSPNVVQVIEGGLIRPHQIQAFSRARNGTLIAVPWTDDRMPCAAGAHVSDFQISPVDPVATCSGDAANEPAPHALAQGFRFQSRSPRSTPFLIHNSHAL